MSTLDSQFKLARGSPLPCGRLHQCISQHRVPLMVRNPHIILVDGSDHRIGERTRQLAEEQTQEMRRREDRQPLERAALARFVEHLPEFAREPDRFRFVRRRPRVER